MMKRKPLSLILQALFLACRNLADESSASNNCEERELNLFRESIKSLRQLAGNLT